MILPTLGILWFYESNLNYMENHLDFRLYTGKRSYNLSRKIWKETENRGDDIVLYSSAIY